MFVLDQFQYNRLYGKIAIFNIVISMAKFKSQYIDQSIESSKTLYRKFSHYLLSLT